MLTYTFSRREKIMLVALALILLAALWYMLVFKGCEENYQKAVSATANAELQYDTASIKLGKMNNMKAELDALKASGALPVALPAYDNVQNLTAQLNAILSAADSYTLTFEDPIADTDGIMRRGVTLVFGCGSYEVAKSILTEIDRGQFRCLVDSVNISQSGASRSTRSSSSIVGTVSSGSAASSAYSGSMHITFFESTI